MRSFSIVLIVAAIGPSCCFGGDVSFNRDIRPIFSENCYYCHGFDENHREAGLRLDTVEGSRDVIEPGMPEDSELLRRIESDDDSELMPPPDSHKNRLSEKQIDLVRRWIEAGAEYEPHWAFTPPVKARPEFNGPAAIDHYVGEQLRQHNIDWLQPASPGQLLRRLTLDLVGLPPGIRDVTEFEAAYASDPSRAYEEAIDRLMQSPHFGERMALEWLDVARYADTNGFQGDAYRTNWPWRDWVVRAFNDNMPYDQFVIEQLAGDLLPDPTTNQLVATAFNRNHMINGEGGAIPAENFAKYAFDRVETTSTAFLGLTVGCCRCHDHKFDPIKQKDYFALYAMFNQMDEASGVSKVYGPQSETNEYTKLYAASKPYIELGSVQDKKKHAELKAAAKRADARLAKKKGEYGPAFVAWVKEMRADQELIPKRLQTDGQQRVVNTAPLDDLDDRKCKTLLSVFLKTDPRWKTINERSLRARAAEKAFQVRLPLVMVMRDDKPQETFVFNRGSYQTPGAPVEADTPEFLPPLPGDAKHDRLALARWLVATENPLTARVAVNRYWQLIFGQGLVATPDDFGLQGALPSHPELLDHLAVEFTESGWDVKRLLKTMVSSRAYQQTSEVSRTRIDSDPKNQYLSRGARYRLDSRLIRDQALSLSGLLSTNVGGHPVMSYQPPGVWEEMSLGRNKYHRDSGEKLYRRSLYTLWRRVVRPTNFFDTSARQNCSVATVRTNTPLHALTLLNDTTYVEAARVWAGNLIISIENEERRLSAAFRAATSRTPSAQEIASLRSELDQSRGHFSLHQDEAARLVSVGEFPRREKIDTPEHAAWTTLCLLILNLDEVISKP